MKPIQPIIGLLVVVATTAQAFELTTHGVLTYRAYQRSVLVTDPAMLFRLGIEQMIQVPAVANQPFSDTYLEMSPAEFRPWQANRPNYEGQIFDVSQMPKREPGFDPDSQNLTLPGWLMRGAIREDDDPNASEPNPKNDTPSGEPIHRVFRHFFDPADNRGMHVYGIEYMKNPDWASGYLNSFVPLPQPNTGSENYFSAVNFREALFRALTLKAKNSDGTFRDLWPDGSGTPSAKDIDRKRYWATAFRTLGDTLHLVQDMAQPQHTRNDIHAGFGFYVFQPLLAGHKSVFENYVEARARGEGMFLVKNYSGGDKAISVAPNTLDLPSYPPVPMFARLSDYWSVIPGDSGRQGQGLADYSNRGFFTAGKNIGNTDYALPNPSAAAYTPQMEAVMAWDGTPLNSSIGNPKVAVLRGTVPDTLDASQTATNVAMSSYSGWDQFLESYVGAARRFNLIPVNYDDQIRLLLPRAISYSAGLINYMFRGRMKITLPDEGVYAALDHAKATGNSPISGGFDKIRLKLENTTLAADGTTREEMSNGYLFAVIRFHRNACYQANLSGEYGAPGMDWHTCRVAEEEVVASDPVPVPSQINGGPHPLSFNFPVRVPISATDIFLQVVFRGTLGADQDAVAVETKDISEPTYAYNFFTWDQYKYLPYPFLDPGNLPFTDWCLQGYPSLDSCYAAMGTTRKYKLRGDTDPVPGYEPSSPIPQNTWVDIAQEPPFTPLLKSVTPATKFTRVAVLMDIAPVNTLLFVEEMIDDYHGRGVFQWFSGVPVAAINQLDTSANPPTLTPFVTYVSGRGVYVPSVEEPRITGHSANVDPATIPNLIVVPSEVNF